ncbi:hypothetical protein SAMN05216229_102180 [Geopseudomonas sagittaria]|uniref:Uncharacterized protein n=1 Tax=Geopseudomonas sagittaria TaxID=1135990 RepID=A0A1I5Q3T1_9GAMM|nr:hypothetical protein [Pseudomonas sagittaria]SFP41018.1 hypothetical protein SAMN05216229_102180 [Pseudomonas sagittaria]
MSLLSPDRYLAVLGPTRVQLARRRGSQLDNLGSAACASRDLGDWAGAVDALEQLLRACPGRRGELAVVLGEHFAHFTLVPWSDAIGTPEELSAYARLRFEEIYGSEAAGWALQLSPEAAGQPRLAVAIAEGLLERLTGLAKTAGLRLVSVQPYLMSAFNRLCRPLVGGDFLFLLAEPERSCLLVAREGRWVAVRSTAGSDSDAALAVLLERESELQELEAQSPLAVYIHAPGRADLAPPPVHGLLPQVLGQPRAAPDEAPDPLWAMAETVS